MSMLIHKGEKYTISTDGRVAEKSDGVTRRTMKYYAERDAAAIAGEIDEPTAWQILHDIAAQAAGTAVPISPDHILIDGPRFTLSEWSAGHDTRFTAPEGYCPVWALGASVFHLYLGCHVFQGLGGMGQTATAPVPVLRRELPELSDIICRCLSHDPAVRPTLTEIETTAAKNLTRATNTIQTYPPLKSARQDATPTDDIDTFWPEEMC